VCYCGDCSVAVDPEGVDEFVDEFVDEDDDVGNSIFQHLPVSSYSCFSYPVGHGLFGKQFPSPFMLNPEGHFPSCPGAHFGRPGSNRHSSSGNDAVACAIALFGTRITVAVEYVKEPNIIIKETDIHRFLFCIYISGYLYYLLKMYQRMLLSKLKSILFNKNNETE
jgi:hypothetical protein